MGETMKLAVPTMGEAGLESERAGHFGHCDCFTVVEIADGEITGTSEVANPPHEEGGCMRPVGLLAKAGVDAIVAAGMGMRPLTGFNQAGITVYFENQTPIVGDAAKLVAAGDERGQRVQPSPLIICLTRSFEHPRSLGFEGVLLCAFERSCYAARKRMKGRSGAATR